MARREFSSITKRLAYARSGGICECCGAKLGVGNTFYEHVIPDQLGGDPTLDNAQVRCKTCWKAKSATYDLPVIAKAKRREDRHHGIERPKVLISGWRKFDGTPVRNPKLTSHR